MPLRDVPLGSIVSFAPFRAYCVGDTAYRVERPMSGTDRHWVRPMAWIDDTWKVSQVNPTCGVPFTIPSERDVVVLD